MHAMKYLNEWKLNQVGSIKKKVNDHFHDNFFILTF